MDEEQFDVSLCIVRERIGAVPGHLIGFKVIAWALVLIAQVIYYKQT